MALSTADKAAQVGRAWWEAWGEEGVALTGPKLLAASGPRQPLAAMEDRPELVLQLE